MVNTNGGSMDTGNQRYYGVIHRDLNNKVSACMAIYFHVKGALKDRKLYYTLL